MKPADKADGGVGIGAAASAETDAAKTRSGRTAEITRKKAGVNPRGKSVRATSRSTELSAEARQPTSKSNKPLADGSQPAVKSRSSAKSDQLAGKSKKLTTKSPKAKKKKPAVKVTLRKLLSFDHDTLFGGGQLQIFAAKAKYIIGVDEVGRGCLAGPVVAAAVLLPLENLMRGLEANSLKKRTRNSPPKCPVTRDLKELNDSKMLSPETREFLSSVIRSNAKFAIAESSVVEIDTINILQASLLAMRRAVMLLCQQHSIDLSEVVMMVDGNRLVHGLPETLCRQITVIGGDSKSASIAAASVIAKVHRDGFMIEMAKQFPSYKWESNKGYGSRVHRDAIRAQGMTEWHRKSFNVYDDTADEDVPDEFYDADAELAERGVNLAAGIASGGKTRKSKTAGTKVVKKSSVAKVSSRSGLVKVKQQELALRV